jgi:hypothetical protein
MDSGSLMRALAAMPAGELARIAGANTVATFMVGFDTDGRCVLWKLRFTDKREALFVLAPVAAIHFTKSTRRQARKRRWADTEPAIDVPVLTQADWDTFQNAIFRYRLEILDDAIVVAFPVDGGSFQAIRLPPALAVRLADLHWDEIQKGKLREAAVELQPRTA